MFKNLFITLLAVVMMASCTQTPKNQFIITGTIDSVFNGTVYLQRRVEAPLKTIDSAQISGGKFSFKGIVNYPEVYYLTIPATKSSVPFFIEPVEIMVNINTKEINKTKIIGSKTQAEYDHYLDQLDQFNARLRESYQMYNAAQEVGDPEKARYYDSVTNAIDTQREEFSKKYVLENNKSFISPYIIYRNSWNYGMEELEKSLSNFDTTLTHSLYMGFLNNYLATLKRTSVGQMYVPFSMQDTSGTLLSVESFIGRNYLLVDFWASWCAPCREENPNIVALYKQYHNRGFDILGVSFDSNRQRWYGAIKDDSLTWSHVSDLSGWENNAGKLYGIRLIPANVLLDPSGLIIARNLQGEALRKKLEELFPVVVQ
jgi:thiol-disulfide isomerase/thioredoxin